MFSLSPLNFCVKPTLVILASRPIYATLIYAIRQSARGASVLMIERAARQGDVHSGKWNGLGGKLRPGETPIEGARREFEEESGISVRVEDLEAVGRLEFPRFKTSKLDGLPEDWWVFVFCVSSHAFVPIREECPEGRLHWVAREKVAQKNLWPGDRLFLPYVLSDPPQRFTGRIEYEAGEVKRSWIAPLGASAPDGSILSIEAPSRS